MFDDLELPNLVRKQLEDMTEFNIRQAGYTTSGSPDRLNVVRSCVQRMLAVLHYPVAIVVKYEH